MSLRFLLIFTANQLYYFSAKILLFIRQLHYGLQK